MFFSGSRFSHEPENHIADAFDTPTIKTLPVIGLKSNSPYLLLTLRYNIWNSGVLSVRIHEIF